MKIVEENRYLQVYALSRVEFHFERTHAQLLQYAVASTASRRREQIGRRTTGVARSNASWC